MKLNLRRRAVASLVCSAAAVGATAVLWPAGSRAAPVAATAQAVADPVPGLVGLYYNDLRGFKALEGVKRPPFFVRVDPQVNFALVDGDFYGTHLTTEFAVLWTGSVHVEKAGTYKFGLKSDDGSKLLVNDKVVVDNTRSNNMVEREGEVTFPAAGDYPVKVEFCQYGGEAGCVLDWQPPGAEKMESVPASALTHAKAAENTPWDTADWELFTKDHKAWIHRHGKPYEKMDYGPFLAGTFDAPEPKGPPAPAKRGEKPGSPTPNTTLKGIIVQVAPDHAADVLFDTTLCRYSAGWTGGFINFNGVAYDGSHGVTPKIKGTQVFGTPEMPGWAHDGSFKDPRKDPYGPMPQDWCHYRGLYRHGDQTVLSYTVGDVGILDLPEYVVENDKKYFARILQVDASVKPLTLALASRANAGLQLAIQMSPGMELKLGSDPIGGVMTATIPPHSRTAQYWIVYDGSVNFPGGRPPEKYIGPVPKPIDFAALTHGGPTRWGEPMVTQGKLGTGDGPYVVDTITAPEKTPYDAWLRFAGFDFFPDGHSAAICTWNGDVWIVKGIDGDLSHLTWQRYATGLFQTLGLKIINNEIYVLGRDQITKLHDLNGDGEADWYENFNNDVQISRRAFTSSPTICRSTARVISYFAKGGPVNSGGRGFESVELKTPGASCGFRRTESTCRKYLRPDFGHRMA